MCLLLKTDLLAGGADVEGDQESEVTGSQSSQGSKPGEAYKEGAEPEPEPAAMQLLATPTRLNTTIYMETVKFLLQNNALQVSQEQANSHLVLHTSMNTLMCYILTHILTVFCFLLSYLLQMAQRALAQELLCPEGGLSSSYHLARARMQLLRGDYRSVEDSLKKALNDSFQVSTPSTSYWMSLYGLYIIHT